MAKKLIDNGNYICVIVLGDKCLIYANDGIVLIEQDFQVAVTQSRDNLK